jgi:hypothetical protein
MVALGLFSECDTPSAEKAIAWSSEDRATNI